MAKKPIKKVTTKPSKQEEIIEKEAEVRGSFFDYLRFGESYTSLILGIVVVIISTVLLLSFVHNRNISKINNQKNNQNIAQVINDVTPTQSPTAKLIPVTLIPTMIPTIKATPTPTAKPKPIATSKPTVTPKQQNTPTPTKKAQPAKIAMKVTPTSAKVAQGTSVPRNGTYTVVKGDNLWNIAEKTYKSGYNWVDIARSNNLSNPGDIHSGDKLVLPKLASKLATVSKGEITPEAASTSIDQNNQPNKITGNSYKIARGDNLWNIAVRAYGDGYKWPEIARANNLSNPGLIHADNMLRIPRG